MNNSGSALVSLLALLPLLLTLACLMVAVSLVLFAQRLSQYTCRSELLRAQSEFAHPLNRLLALNPQAIELHIEYEIAKKAAEATGAGSAYLAEVIARMELLRAKQEFFKLQLQTIPTARLWRLPLTLTQAFLQNYLPTRAVAPQSVAWAAAALRYERLDWLLGTYHPQERFSERQLRQFNWSLHLDLLLPQWFKFYLQNHLVISGHCAATVQLKEGLWVSTLTQAR